MNNFVLRMTVIGWGLIAFGISFVVSLFREEILNTVITAVATIFFLGMILEEAVWRIRNPF